MLSLLTRKQKTCEDSVDSGRRTHSAKIMTDIAVGSGQTDNQQLDHANSFTGDERRGTHLELSQRSTAAAYVRRLVEYVDASRDRMCAGETVDLDVEAGELLKNGGNDLPMNTLRYLTHLMEYYFDCIFEKGCKETRASLTKQIVAAVKASAVHTGSGPGGLKKEVVRQWDVKLGDMTWDEWLVKINPRQLEHCFHIIAVFYASNVDFNRFTKDIFHYRHFADVRGMELFEKDEFYFARVLRCLFSCFTQSVQGLLRRAAFAAAVAGRGNKKRIRDTTEDGWSAWAYYVFTSQLLKRLADNSMYYTIESEKRTSWVQDWSAEGHIKDGSKLHVPNETFLPLAKSVTAALSSQLCVVGDLALRPKSDFIRDMVQDHLSMFCSIVRQLAPVSLLLRTSKGGTRLVEPTDIILEPVWERVLCALWNTRAKMLKNNDLTLMQEMLTASFRGDKASKQSESTTNAFKKLKRESLKH